MTAETQTWLVATRRSRERVTIADVAREAGVNKGTVSRALRGVSGVGPSTRERILAAADRLEFSASPIATALATGLSQTVGIVLPTLRSWYFSEVASGASEVLIPAGFRVELINLDIHSDLLEVESDQFRRLLSELGAGRGRDALLFAGNISADLPDQGAGIGHVPVATSPLPVRPVPGIHIDNQVGGRLVAEHLLSLGHRSFAVFDGRLPAKPDPRIWQQRTAGFVAGLRSAGLELSPAAVIMAGDCQPANGEAAAQRLLAGSELPTAVFCHADELAFGVLAALRRAGVRCPEEVSVVGFDDHPMARLWDLTTIDQHAHEQGARAARALISALRDRVDVTPDCDLLTVDLIVRGTTAPPRA